MYPRRTSTDGQLSAQSARGCRCQICPRPHRLSSHGAAHHRGPRTEHHRLRTLRRFIWIEREIRSVKSRGLCPHSPRYIDNSRRRVSGRQLEGSVDIGIPREICRKWIFGFLNLASSYRFDPMDGPLNFSSSSCVLLSRGVSGSIRPEPVAGRRMKGYDWSEVLWGR